MITTIGEGCFLQNWLHMKAKQAGIQYSENMLSRLAAYNPDIWNKSVVLEKLQRYDDFCSNFLKTGKIVKNTFVSDEEHCKLHFSHKMHLEKLCNNLKTANVVLYLARFQNNNAEALANINAVYENLRKVSNAFFVAFSRFAKTTKVNDKFQIVYLPNDCTYTDNETAYVPHWNVSEKNQDILEKSFQKIFIIDKKA